MRKSEVKFYVQNVELFLKPLNFKNAVQSKTMLDKFAAVGILQVSSLICFLD